MRATSIILSIALLTWNCNSAKSLTYKLQTKKGFIFLSANDPFKNKSSRGGDHFNFIFLPDIFFPLDAPDSDKTLLEGFSRASLKKGMELYEVKDRDLLINASKIFNNDTTQSFCYKATEFRLLKVELRYKLWKDNSEDPVCANPTVLAVDGTKITFQYKTPSIEIQGFKIID
jgi:hypothetical protein